MIGLRDVNLLRMSNKLCIIIGKITTFVLLNFTNYVVELMLKFYQSVNSVHCITYSTFHDPKNSDSVYFVMLTIICIRGVKWHPKTGSGGDKW